MFNLILSYSLSLLTLTYLGNSLLKKRYHYRLVQSMIFIFCVFCFFLVLFLYGVEISSYKTYIITVSCLVYLLWVYKDQTIKKLIIFIFFILDDFVSEVLSTICLLLTSVLNEKSTINSFHYTVAVFVSFFFLLSLANVLIKLIKILNWEHIPKYIYIIFILPLSTISLIFCLHNYLYFIINDYIFIIILLGLIVSNYITIYLFLKIVNGIKKMKDLDKIKNEKKLLDLKYDIINNQYNSSFYFMHDLIREFMKAEKYLNHNDYETFKSEMIKINRKMLKEFNMINSNSIIISPLLNYNRNDFVENNIEFKAVIEYNDFSFLNTYTQCTLFNMLLDLSINQCKKVIDNDRIIILKTKKLQNNVVIQVIFTHNQPSKELTSSLVELENLLKKYNSKVSFNMLYD